MDGITSHPLQTRVWGEFRKKWGNEVVRLPFGQLTLHRVPFTNYKIGIFEKGPKPTQEMLDALRNLAEEKNLIFIKLEPNVPINILNNTDSNSNKFKLKSDKLMTHMRVNLVKEQETQELQELLASKDIVSGKALFTPTTFWIDLTKSEEELMKSFSSKTRYNIRLAQKLGVEVVEDNSDKAFEKYIQLTRETVKRQGFYAHSEKYHRLMWEYLHKIPISKSQIPIARLLTAKYKGEIITTWILFVWKDFLYYPYGASSEKYKNVMANNLVMWEAIRYGRNLKLKTFDLWGREPGKGFTKFKEGYNPQVVEFLGTWDLITSPFYWPYRLAESLRWSLLRLKSKFLKPEF